VTAGGKEVKKLRGASSLNCGEVGLQLTLSVPSRRLESATPVGSGGLLILFCIGSAAGR
jgi:hypothetical protein